MKGRRSHDDVIEVTVELSPVEVNWLRAFLRKKARDGQRRVAARQMDKALQRLARIRADFMAWEKMAEAAPNRAELLEFLREFHRVVVAVSKAKRPTLAWRFLPLLQWGPERRLELASRVEGFRTWGEMQAFRAAITHTDSAFNAGIEDAMSRTAKGGPPTWGAFFEQLAVQVKNIETQTRVDPNYLRAVVVSVSRSEVVLSRSGVVVSRSGGDTVETRNLTAARRRGIPWSVLDDAIPFLCNAWAIPFNTSEKGELAQIIGILADRSDNTAHAWLKAWKKRSKNSDHEERA